MSDEVANWCVRAVNTSDKGHERRGGSDGDDVIMMGNTDNTPGESLAQQESASTDNAICLPPQKARDSSQMVTKPANDGERLDQVLAAHGLNRARLARKVGVAASTCQKWADSLARGDITDSMWHSCARALIQVGIDPRDVRPSAQVPTRTRMAELIPAVMSEDDPRRLNLMLELLTIDEVDNREALVTIIRTKLLKS